MKNYLLFLNLAMLFLIAGCNSCNEAPPCDEVTFDRGSIIKQVQKQYDNMIKEAKNDNFNAFEKYYHKEVSGLANGHLLGNKEIPTFMFDLVQSFFGNKPSLLQITENDFRVENMSQLSKNPEKSNAGYSKIYAEARTIAYQEFCVQCSPTDTTRGCAGPIPESVFQQLLEYERENSREEKKIDEYEAKYRIKTICVTCVWDYRTDGWVITKVHVSYGFKSEEAYE